jgi:hypothetical protein
MRGGRGESYPLRIGDSPGSTLTARSFAAAADGLHFERVIYNESTQQYDPITRLMRRVSSRPEGCFYLYSL